MKLLKTHAFDASKCRNEWLLFDALLKSKPVLSESKDILPFFKANINLSLLICYYFPFIKMADSYHHEFQIQGDFVADLVVGNSTMKNYLLIEFEDGQADSIFKQKRGKQTPDWSSRLEGAFSQLVDWTWKLEDMRSTVDFQNTFKNRRAKFQGLIILGKDVKHSDREIDRLQWRMNRTMVDSTKVSIITFDELRDDMDYWLQSYHQV